MRYLVTLVSTVSLVWIAEAVPAAARDYPYCLQSRSAGIPGDCSFPTREACMAAASGEWPRAPSIHAWRSDGISGGAK
jgi:hypothetical protein